MRKYFRFILVGASCRISFISGLRRFIGFKKSIRNLLIYLQNNLREFWKKMKSCHSKFCMLNFRYKLWKVCTNWRILNRLSIWPVIKRTIKTKPKELINNLLKLQDRKVFTMPLLFIIPNNLINATKKYRRFLQESRTTIGMFILRLFVLK